MRKSQDHIFVVSLQIFWGVGGVYHFLTRFAVLLQRVSSPKFLQFGLGWFFVAQSSTTITTQVQWYIQVRVQA